MADSEILAQENERLVSGLTNSNVRVSLSVIPTDKGIWVQYFEGLAIASFGRF
ncbi:MAG: hypothetical protein O4859_02075 [Trichodesmium sp. St18_bin1]|nr:hypothetical protein [Trichodesmium sp. St18_bin1]MDE5119030.1 hypothetical protein [Trichodesmium sp. St19_bin1]